MSQQNPWDFSDFSDDTQAQQRPQQLPPQGRPGVPSAPADQGLFGPADGQRGGEFFGGAPEAPAPVTGFGPAAEPMQQLVTAKAPVQWLGLSAGLALVGLLLALILGGLPPVAIGAWALCGPLAIGLLAYFMTADLKARSGAVYAAQGWVRIAYWAALGLCLIGAMVAAWRIADWVGRL
ncbi:hypothetical protein ACQBAR_15135 [Propionibacteriaceae bacterium Y1685]|uniref:hypothetical protein n=1 Tax=Microlunatus sp. Y1700 TaxID=3418487 RepID=UPI003B79DE09